MLSVVMAVVLFSHTALACEGDCMFKEGTAKWMLTEIEGSGFLAVMTVAGTPEEIKAVTDKVEAKIGSCTAGTCDCKGAHHCPFLVKGLDYKVSRTEKGLLVEVTGGCPGKRGMFKQLMEAQSKGTIHDGKGECPHAHKKEGCKGDGSCGCKDGKKEGCKGDGSCGCHKDKK